VLTWKDDNVWSGLEWPVAIGEKCGTLVFLIDDQQSRNNSCKAAAYPIDLRLFTDIKEDSTAN